MAAFSDESPVVTFIRSHEGMAARMLAQHVDDGSGHCAGCAWQETSRPVWPCLIRWYAVEADKVARQLGSRDG